MHGNSHRVGQRIVAVGMPSGASAEDAAAAAGRIVSSLRARLGRWIGGDAFDALFDRALAETRVAHPAVACVRREAREEPRLAGLADAPGVTADAVREAVAAMLDELTNRLGRFIGDELAARLVLEDWEPPQPENDQERKP